ncbi:MAG: hypothetical protein Q4D16_14295 [Eubacteriales bacterium]|nr:hypothetical protein [Eubacteriales bacterium]
MFDHIYFETINWDVLINANNSVVVLDIEADGFDHDITVEGSESDPFRSVSVYLDKLPDNVRLDFNITQDGRINDPQSILKQNKFEAGLGKPVISINNTKNLDIYVDA